MALEGLQGGWARDNVELHIYQVWSSVLQLLLFISLCISMFLVFLGILVDVLLSEIISSNTYIYVYMGNVIFEHGARVAEESPGCKAQGDCNLLPLLVNKGLLQHSHAQSFKYCPWLLWHYRSRTEWMWQRFDMPCLKYLLYGPL